MRRIQILGLALGALVLATAAGAQEATGPRVLIEPDRDVTQALQEARQSIAKKQYQSAALLLQRVLDQPEDFFVEKSFANDLGNRGGTRKEAQQLLMSMPAEGQAAYELEYGATARSLFVEATAAGDAAGVAEVVRRFAVTAAGYDATMSLAAHAFDSDRPLEAALLLDTVRNHPGRTPQLSVLRAVCWTRAGRAERGFAALRDLKRSGSTGKVRIGAQEVSLPIPDENGRKLLQAAAARVVAQPVQVPSWSMAGGGPSRNVSAISASPVGGNIWQVSTLAHLTLDGRADEDRGHRTRFQQVLQKVAHGLQEENQLSIPAAQPLVVGDTVVYRTLGDVTAVSLRTGELLWRSSLVDEVLVRLMNTRTLEARGRMARFGIPQPVITLEGHIERRTYRDVAAGMLSSDGQAVFALEELDTNSNTLGLVGSAANKLVAYDLAGGRMLWEVGGPRGSKPTELSAQFFLGPPLPLDDRLYVLSEGHGAIQLMALKQDPDRQSVQQEWFQALIPADVSVSSHPMRRLSGLSPSYADGIMVCPTSSGYVVAIDLTHRSLAWGFQYKSLVQIEPRRGNFLIDPSTQTDQQLEDAEKSARWLDSTPVIADGRVLITARDSDRLFCLDLVDGHEVWQIPRDDWMYVAGVVDGRVILVGRHGVGAVQLSDGEAVDGYHAVVQTTGRGVRDGMSYYVPTSTGEIATLDLRTGKIIARSKLTGSLIPGNLAAGGGAIVSQSASEVVGFSPLPAIEKQIADQLKADPNDSRALALRGELRLHRGDEAAGLMDLRESLKRRPDPYVKTVLAAALLASLRNDTTQVRERVKELEQITDDPQQKNEFLLLYTKVLEAAGDHRTAFAQMIRLAENSQFLDTLETVDARYFARTDRSIRSRLIDTYQATAPADRAELDKIVEQHILSAVEHAHIEHLHRCLRFFSGLPKVDSVLLKLTLEMKGIEEPQRQDLLRSFMRSSDPQVAAQATSLRCRELIQANLWPEAARLITRLRTEFANQVCLDGKTGKSLAEQWSARDELQALLKPPAVWAPGVIEFTRTQRPRPQRQIPAEILSRFGTSMAGWSFETNLGGNILIARNALGIVRWNLALPTDAEFHENGMRSGMSSQIHIRDNWLTVTHNGHFAVVDASSTVPRVAWQQTLRLPGTANDDWSRVQRIRMGLKSSAPSGRVIALTRETVIYSVGTKLLASELETGRMVWSRDDQVIASASADDRIVAINSNGVTTLLRTLDGAILVKRPPEKGTPLWTRGSQQFLWNSQGDTTVFELRDQELNVVTWTRSCPKNSLAAIIDDDDVAILEPAGQLIVLRLADGHERYLATLPVKLGAREKFTLTVQRNGDFDLIFSGETFRHRDSAVIAFETDGTLVPPPFDGSVCAVSHDGRVLWTRKVERVAFDPTQPASLPVLLLASRHRENPVNTPFGFNSQYRMTAEVIDKRDGRQVYWTDETATAIFAPTLEPMPDSGRILVNFPEWQLELAVPGKIAVPTK